MLYLKNPDEREEIDIKKNCKTLQIHETSSKLREVEVLYDFILSVLKKEKIKLSEISVLIPNVDEYIPYIHMVFSESLLDYKISKFKKSNFFTKGIIHLFSLVKSRFEKNFVLELFENEAFSKKHKITKEDLLKLKKWIEMANIDWGLDEEHKKSFLKSFSTDLHLKSWERGIDRILSSFIFAFKDLDYEIPPIKGINFSDLDLFEKFIKIFEALKEDAKRLKKKFSLKEWGTLLFEIVEKNFFLKENAKEASDFRNFIKKLTRANELSNSFFDFDIIFENLKKELLNKKSSFNEFSVEAISFSSFKNSFIPKKVICLLGMGENFPKKDNFCSLSLLDKRDYPLKKDIEKNYFLESILSCQNFLYLSYVKEREKDISSLVKELLHYINLAYGIKDKKLITIHPLHSFDKKYFLKEHEKFFSFSEKNYLTAKKFFSTKKSKEEKSFFQLKNPEENLPDVLDIRDLKLLSNNPLKFYFNKIFDIFLKEEKKEELFLSFLEKYILLERVKEEKDFFEKFEKKGGMPSGLLREIEKENIEEKMEKYFEGLKAFEIEKKDIFEIELKLFSKTFRKISPNKIEIPAITLSLENRKIKIIGKIKNISEKGFLINSDLKPFEILKRWPEILIFLHLKNFEKNLLFTKGNRKLNMESINAKESLKNYLKYYQRCLSSPSPLLRDFTKILFVRGEKELKEVIEKALSSKKIFEDIYFEKVFPFEKALPYKEIFENWIPFFKKTFKPIIEIYEKL
jgi:exodeoxyribonuclease V gamma subunit